jgi:hypothetical protein
VNASSLMAAWTSPQALEDVRPKVRDLLTAIPSYSALSPDEQRQLAANMVKVMSYINDPNGLAETVARPPPPQASPSPAPTAGRPVLARAQDAVEDTKASLSRSPGMVGKDFKAGATAEGVKQFGALVQKVDFPKFVGGLIKNVFQAIVESSIEQMRAYGELIANVAKTVDQFMNDNISAGAGRDFLAERYPDALGVEVNANDQSFADGAPAPAPTATLVTRGDNAEVRLAEISHEMNLNPPITDITDANAELRLVTAARLQMAKSRQQMLASMVMLGINRIVVTDGSINAKVIFDMRASDTAKRVYAAQMHDSQEDRAKQTMNVGYGGWMSPVDVSYGTENEQAHVATVGSSVDETSESKAEVKAKLSGEVRLNFKSDYLPLEKMATPEMMSVMQGNSTPYNPNRPAPAAAATRP